MRKKNRKALCRKIVLRLPDLDHTKTAILNSLSSPPLHTAPNYHTFSRLTEVPFSQRGPAILA
jgi:hypothetical protein